MLGLKPIRKRKSPDLIDLRIASPCPAEWSKMTGTDRVRHCSECDLKVYNFSGSRDSQQPLPPDAVFACDPPA